MDASGSPFLTMDPNVTLFTFMVRTDPAVKSVQLLGSWDNFSKYYKMERDSRRDRGQWRGCHTLQNTNQDGTRPKKNWGGLKQGETYYYYYEVDGSLEVHDPAMPSTNVCPYLPGQTVNKLDVPIEHSSRSRSASMNSVRDIDFRTLDPGHKFITPRPARPAHDSFGPRPGTAHAMQQLHHKSSSRSLSPSPWAHAARRIFGLRPSSRSSDQGSLSKGSESSDDARLAAPRQGRRSATPEGTRSRDMSPEALQRFLSDDPPTTTGQPVAGPLQPLIIPEVEDVGDEIDDDDNFATSAASETAPFTTLSPPPFQRSPSTSSSANESQDPRAMLASARTALRKSPAAGGGRRGPPPGMRVAIPRSHFPMSAASSAVVSPTSPESTISFEDTGFSFFDDSNDEDLPSSTHDDTLDSTRHPLAAYSLPGGAPSCDKHEAMAKPGALKGGSPALVARTESGVPVGNTALLSLTGVDSNLDDLVHEIGWLAHAL